MSGTCKTCKHWDRHKFRENGRYPDYIAHPHDDAIMTMPFSVFRCVHPAKTFCERPVEINGFGTEDGSNYRAELYTAEEFGCVRWESLNGDA